MKTARPERSRAIEIEDIASRAVFDDLRDGTRPLRDEPQDLLFALHPVTEQVPDILLRIGHRRPVRRVIGAVLALPELVEALHVGGHVAVGRHDHGRRPAHHMIAAEQGVTVSEAEVVGGVAGSGDGTDGPAINLQHFAIL